MMEDYFTNLFTATETNWQTVISCIGRKISDVQNEALLSPIEEIEVK